MNSTARPGAAALAALDQNFTWHPFTQMREWCDPEREPVILTEGCGAVLRDSLGREYLDGNSSIWTNLHGHRHPKIDAAIREQLDKVAHVSYLGTGNEPASMLAEKLVSLFPPDSLTRVFFSDDGSTAVEVALKMTAQFWQLAGHPERDCFVAFENAYHGDTLGAASLCGVGLFSERFARFQFPVERVGSVAELRESPALREGRLAGVVIEPLVQGVNRMHLWPCGMLRELRELCDESGALLILDEVMTGFGRTGHLFAHRAESILPDVLCLAKGLTGGYLPLAATLVTDRIFSMFLGGPMDGKTFFYGHSYTANPLGCAAALASLRIFEEEDTLATVALLSSIFSGELEAMKRRFRFIGDIRQLGLVAGIDIVGEDGQSLPGDWRAGFHVCEAARRHGLLTRGISDTVVLMPPFCTTPGQISKMVEAVGMAAEEVVPRLACRSGGFER